MSASHPVTKTVQEFDRFCPQVGEGLTGRAARLESWAGTEASPGGPADAPEDAERLSYRLALGAAPGTNARWLEAVLAEDELRRRDKSGSRCAERRWNQFRELADLLAFTLEQTEYKKLAPAVSCAAMGTFTPRRRTHVPSGFALLKCVPVRCVLFIASDQ
jgi:hypothetical protein